MAKQTGSAVRKRLKYFFMNGEFHKLLRVVRQEDMIISWNYSQKRRVSYSLSGSQHMMQRGYTITEVARLFNMSREHIHDLVTAGKLRVSGKAYVVGRDEGRYVNVLSEDDVWEAHTYFRGQHHGKPRKDGIIVNNKLPPRREVEALMRDERILYTKNSLGELVPVWKSPQW
jgi:hypothetical protein